MQKYSSEIVHGCVALYHQRHSGVIMREHLLRCDFSFHPVECRLVLLSPFKLYVLLSEVVQRLQLACNVRERLVIIS